ncbi:MAG: hypothetical protein J6X61_00525, partial [Clostridia bacterium]|nr:hypothetical protein [Clostridia bacterium]
VLDRFAPEKKGLLASFSGRREIDSEELTICAAHREERMELCETILAYNRTLEDNAAEQLRLRANIDQLEPWRALDVPFIFEGTATTAAFIGSLPAYYTMETLAAAIEEKEPGLLWTGEIVSAVSTQTCLFLLTPKESGEALMRALRALGFAKPMGARRSLPADKVARLEARIKELDESSRQTEQALAAFGDRRREIEDVCDYYTVRADKYDVIGEIDHSRHAFLITGYLPAVDCDKVEGALLNTCPCVVDFFDADPEQAPVKLHNNAFVAPVESIVEMYAMPNVTDIDPTPVMAFFFYFFFGMMFSDAGYGLLMILGTTWILRRFRPEESMRNSMRMFRYCGVFTTLWGLVYASFFGDAIPTVIRLVTGAPAPSIPLITTPLLDPIKDSTLLMVISVAFGLIQILVGIGAKFYVLWRQGDKIGAIFDCGSWMLLLVGVAVLASGLMLGQTVLYIGAGIAGVAALALVCSQGRDKKNPIMKIVSGLASLYDSTSYISDLMSYTRLLALGLTTAIMGNVFNVLSAQFAGSPWTFIPMILVFIIGHAINFGLNALGSYVHAIRLQYVEMFGKFYEGGGRRFNPFALRSKYTRLREENKQ